MDLETQKFTAAHTPLKIEKPNDCIFNSSEKITNQLIEELKDPTLFVRSCILRGSKYTSSCIQNFEIAIKHINEQLEKYMFELGQVKTIKNLCQEFEKLDFSSKSISINFSKYKNSLDEMSTSITKQYDDVKENVMVSRRVLQIQDFCNRTIEFISLISHLKLLLGISKNVKYEDQYEKFFQEFQDGIPESIDISKTSQIIFELENMIYFNEDDTFEVENYLKKEKNDFSKTISLEFLEELQEDIKWLRKVSAIYRQYGHKRLIRGIDNMDKSFIYSGCIILDQFNELSEHIEILIDDVILKQIHSAFQVGVLQKCIESEISEDQAVLNTEFVIASVLFSIEKAVNQLILGSKKLIYLSDIIVENNLKSNMNKVNFVSTFWEKSLMIFEGVFNNIYSINLKHPNQNFSLNETINITGKSLKLEQLFQILVISYPDISSIFNIAIKNIRALISNSSVKTPLNNIVDERNFFDTICKIRENYLFIVKQKFDHLFQSILPSKKISLEPMKNLKEKVATVVKIVNTELDKTKNSPDIYQHIYEIFKNQILYFIVACETVIQPEGGIILFNENIELSIENDNSTEMIYSKSKHLFPIPMNSHFINARVSNIVALFSLELENMNNNEFTNTWDINEKKRTIELLKSLLYKSTGKWFSQVLAAIIQLNKNTIFAETCLDYETSDKNKIEFQNEEKLIIKAQLIVNNFVQEWLPMLSPPEIWYKCYVLFCRNIIVIFLVNFSLKNNFDEKNCFSIAETIVSLQSIISQFTTTQVVKGQLENDLKMMQDFRRILFSDLTTIKQAINSSKSENENFNNLEVLEFSIKNLNPILLSVYLFNRIYFSIKEILDFIPSFVDFSKLSNFQIANTISLHLYKNINDRPISESDSDLFLIFDIFKQNAINEYIYNLNNFTLLIDNYINLLIKELNNFGDTSSNFQNRDEIIIILNFLKANLLQ